MHSWDRVKREYMPSPACSVELPCYVCLQTAQLDRPDVCREGINLVFNSRVAAVDKEQVTVINKCVMCMG